LACVHGVTNFFVDLELLDQWDLSGAEEEEAGLGGGNDPEEEGPGGLIEPEGGSGRREGRDREGEG
jgi:hypothetical protein